MTTARVPLDPQQVRVLPALGRFEDFCTVVAPRSAGAGGCWCMAYRDSRVATDERGAFMARECDTPPGPGVLAYVGEEVAGWCSVAPRSSYRRLMHSRTIPTLDDRDPWSIVCFVVRAGYRRRGLAHLLLAGAVDHARASGGQVVEGYPVDAGGRVDQISGYVGNRELFESAGFTLAVPTTGRSGGRPRVLMRLELGQATADRPEASR
jgi:GNAT superfamily N-acetyltransferase